MKKILILTTCFLLAIIANAQVLKTINVVTAGTLSSSLTSKEKATITDIIITGNIDARDVKCMRDEITKLAVLDLSSVNILAYNGTGGTGTGMYNPITSFSANEMPVGSFSICNSSVPLYGKTSLKKIILPISLTLISQYAFFGCSGLTGNLSIPISVTKIGMYAFSKCSGLYGSLIIPHSVTSIGDGAFSWCTGLNGSVTIPNSVKSIPSDAFCYCSGLTSVTFGNSVTSIGSGAFESCGSLKIINCLNSSVSTLGTDCFKFANILVAYVPANAVEAYKAASGWSSLTIAAEKKVTINNTIPGGLAANIITSGYGPIPSITHLTVKGNINNSDIMLMSSNMSILTDLDMTSAILEDHILPDNAFKDKITLTSMKLPANLEIIGSYAFSGTLISGEIDIPQSVNSIRSYAFQNCHRLVGDLMIHDSVTQIGDAAFSGCSGLTGCLNFPKSVTKIGSNAFLGCSGFTGELFLPSSITSISNYAFYGCSGLTGSLIIPNTVTTIGSNAFTMCSSLTGSLDIPNAVTSIGTYAFTGCKGFADKLIIPKSVISIGGYAFSGCSGLSGLLNIPNSITSIGNNSFDGCSGITELQINTNTSTINNYAFNGCTNLQKITVARTVPPVIFANTFSGVNKSNCSLEVPINTSLSYQTTNYWDQFAIVVEKNFETGTKKNPANRVHVYTSQSQIIVDGTVTGEEITFYTTGGVKLAAVKSDNGRISLPVQQGEVYLVKTTSKTFKVAL